MDTVYNLLIQLVGEPVGEWGPYVLYVCSCFISCFVLYALLNLILTLFRWIWGQK